MTGQQLKQRVTTGSPARSIQARALIAEQAIVGAVSMMILFDFFARLARGVVVVNGCFSQREFYFSGEPWTCDHELTS
jgi:hypothetical protein